MAKKNNGIVYIILLLLAGLIGYIIYDYVTTPRYDWNLRYRQGYAEPYDNQIIHNLLSDIRDENGFHEWNDTTFIDTDLNSIPEGSNYIFIGDDHYLTQEETQFLIRFVEKGNNAFVISSSPSFLLIDTLLSPRDEYEYYIDDMGNYNNYHWRPMGAKQDSIATMKLRANYDSTESGVSISHIYNWKPSMHAWRYFKDSLYTRAGWLAEPLGYISAAESENLNYIRFPVGEGQLFLHSTPLLFTNFHMLNDDVAAYAEHVFSAMGKGDIYWDEYNHQSDPHYTGSNDVQPLYDDEPTEGALIFILRQPGLKTAWFLILLAALLYVIFGGRRKQRAIPVQIPLSNTSVEYAETIAQLFMKERDHKKLVLLKMDLFKAFLRERFSIRIPSKFEEENAKFYSYVAEVSHTSVALVTDIFEKFKYLSSIQGVSTEQMLEFYNQMENFYHTCK